MFVTSFSIDLYAWYMEKSDRLSALVGGRTLKGGELEVVKL